MNINVVHMQKLRSSRYASVLFTSALHVCLPVWQSSDHQQPLNGHKFNGNFFWQAVGDPVIWVFLSVVLFPAAATARRRGGGGGK